MCGIVAAAARREVSEILMEGLRRLEYRGYDSSGVAILNGNINCYRKSGKVSDLEQVVDDEIIVYREWSRRKQRWIYRAESITFFQVADEMGKLRKA